MGSHKYGRYLHILTPVGADGAHSGQQPWEGITGRVKQETNRLMAEMQQVKLARDPEEAYLVYLRKNVITSMINIMI